ncbi:MAG: HEAT repeat domain-containing protein [Pirellulaceae bacterium]|nr:HEAT repeat domain-containing protein [Pirellulaceae bacterium]
MSRIIGPTLVFAVLIACAAATTAQVAAQPAAARLRLESHDRICVIGNALAERMQHDGWLETLLQHHFPQQQLVVRNLGFGGDELELRLRSPGFGSPDEHLERIGADVVLAFFGYNESFAGQAGEQAFRRQLDEFVTRTLAQRYNGRSAPRLVLVTPNACEDHSDPHLPDPRRLNGNLQRYARIMSDVAATHRIPLVELFHATQAAYASSTRRLTINGIHLNSEGNRVAAELIVRGLFPDLPAVDARSPRLQALRAAVQDKNFHWFQRHRTVDGYSIYGGRSYLRFSDGRTNREVLQREMEVLDQMTANRDRRIWSLAQGRSGTVDDSKLPPLLPVETNLPGPGPDGAHEFLSGEESIDRMQVAEGLRVNLFASEEQFPELANPVQMTFDARGRLWVAVMPSYPHWKPGEVLDDKILILEDTDRDGRADRCTVFAGGLHVPTGLELYGRGVFVGAQPDLMFLQDTDGDDWADVRTRVLHGIDSADTHHALNSFVLAPDGALYFQEGPIHHTQVETIWGPPRRNVNGGVYRYEPRTHKFDVHVAYDFTNPHGQAFDRWGQSFVSDATGNINYFLTPLSGHVTWPARHARYFPFLEQRVRPSAACEILSSRHFPDQFEGDYLIANVIGTQGVLRYRMQQEGSGFRGVELPPLVSSRDPNFRPVDLEIGPDGALYIVDWHNPLIGHMQHHVRDPGRDRTHGRIYRLSCPDRPLAQVMNLANLPIPELLDLLKQPDDRLRYRVRIELSGRESRQVMEAVDRWVAALDAADPDDAHHRLEALWLCQSHDRVHRRLLDQLLESPEPRARAAATRVLCAWRERVDDPLGQLRRLARDADPRVRLEVVRACSFFLDTRAVEAAIETLRQPTDRFLDYALAETIRTLRSVWQPILAAGQAIATDHPAGAEYLLDQLTIGELLALPASKPVCGAWLQREQVPHERRHEALMFLAERNQTSMAVELLAAVGRLDQSPSPRAASVLAELTHLLAGHAADQLADQRAELQQLANHGRLPLTRQLALATLIAVDRELESVWTGAARSPAAMRDLLEAIPLVADPSLRAAAHPRLVRLVERIPARVSEEPELAVQVAAVQALAATGKEPAETVRLLGRMMSQTLASRPAAALRTATVRALGQIPLRSWPADQVRPTIEDLVANVARLPADQRSSDAALNELALASRLAGLLPPETARDVRQRLRELGVHVIVVRPVPRQMRYDRTQLYVEAGRQVEIVLDNVDVMPHNLVLLQPGSLAKVGLASERQVGQLDQSDPDYVPDLPEVLLATRLVQPGERDRLSFAAPRETGEYPFVCTFPGHWRRMYGTLHVVERLDDVPLSQLAPAEDPAHPPRPFVRDWKLADLEQDVAAGIRGRSFDSGKSLFTELACAVCHRAGDAPGAGAGPGAGPDLASVRGKIERREYQPRDVLREILEPSARIDPQYALVVIQDVMGRVHTGIVADRDANRVRLRADPRDNRDLVTIRVADIDQEISSPVSLMPAGLLNTLSRDEVLDLLAFVLAGGDPRHPAFDKRP